MGSWPAGKGDTRRYLGASARGTLQSPPRWEHKATLDRLLPFFSDQLSAQLSEAAAATSDLVAADDACSSRAHVVAFVVAAGHVCRFGSAVILLLGCKWPAALRGVGVVEGAAVSLVVVL